MACMWDSEDVSIVSIFGSAVFLGGLERRTAATSKRQHDALLSG